MKLIWQKLIFVNSLHPTIVIMKILITFGFIFWITCSLQAQQMPDTISIMKNQVAHFYHHGKKLKPNNLMLLTKSNKEAYREMRVAKGKHDAAGILGFAGGFIIGWQFVNFIQKESAPIGITAVGVGALIASIPFSNSYSKHATKAVRIYNSSLKNAPLESQKLGFGMTSNGVGLSLTF